MSEKKESDCLFCPIFQYRISQQMVEVMKDGELREHHLNILENLI